MLRPGKPQWQGMLSYTADLHRRSIRPAQPPFFHPWEEIGPGYCYGPAFGHWDTVHQVLDWMPVDPEHVARQIKNLFAVQQCDGFMPGATRWHDDGRPLLQINHSHPPVWVFAVEDHYRQTGSLDLIRAIFAPARHQLAWFEAQRRATRGGYYYCDITKQTWESGVDEGIRFDTSPALPLACVDATAHVYALTSHLALWAERLGENASAFTSAAQALQNFIRASLFAPNAGFFHDHWAIDLPAQQCICFEGLWPVIVGAASSEQAQRVIHENLMNPAKLFCDHPVATVARDDPRFELRMWRGPAWNSMTYWAARGCMRYGAHREAAMLLERALDDSAAQYERTGTIWEFYHPHGGKPEDVQRKPDTPFNQPCREYLGHNPLLAMARMYDSVIKL